MLYLYCVSLHNYDRGLMTWFLWMQILAVLQVTPTERELPVVQAFLETEEYQTYVEDAKVCMRITSHNVIQVRGFKECVWNNMFFSVVGVDLCLSTGAVC